MRPKGFPVALWKPSASMCDAPPTREEVQAVVDGIIADLEKQGIALKK